MIDNNSLKVLYMMINKSIPNNSKGKSNSVKEEQGKAQSDKE
jgi:hypothetical protein